MKYLSFDFSQFNEKGLKKVIAEFKKNQLQVTSVEADNKPKRQSGVQTKKAVLHFSDGQKLMLQATAQGAIFQVRLNTRVIPVKHVDDLKKAIAEVAAKVASNSKQFQKQQAKRSTKVIKRIDSSTKARTSLKAQTALAGSDVEELKKSIKLAKEEKQELSLEVRALGKQKQELNEHIAVEEQVTAPLEEKIKELELELEAQ